ncbi:roadblock/LC7 domain-containing protein [Streptomyces sp. NPDC092952]|uniref:roadblock/LC7 domain-containing protein n=1 Tax=Streptomyces sp. NPDC092952 TaxID=3366018 RepID=UPI00381691D7
MNQIQHLLDQRVSAIPHVIGAVVATNDGLLQYMTGWDVNGDVKGPTSTESARTTHGEYLSVLASSMANMAARQSDAQGGGPVLRTLVEMEHGWCVIARAGDHCVVALHALHQANLRQLGFETAELANWVGGVVSSAVTPTSSGSEPQHR